VKARSLAEHRTSNIEQGTSNVEQGISKIEQGMLKCERPWFVARESKGLFRSSFDVPCSMFDVRQIEPWRCPLAWVTDDGGRKAA
jgi:hypothetical protein